MTKRSYLIIELSADLTAEFVEDSHHRHAVGEAVDRGLGESGVEIARHRSGLEHHARPAGESLVVPFEALPAIRGDEAKRCRIVERLSQLDPVQASIDVGPDRRIASPAGVERGTRPG